MREIMLVYAEPGPWRPANFLPYVAYVDRTASRATGSRRDPVSDVRRRALRPRPTSTRNKPQGLEFYLDEEFAPGREFAALDQTVEEAARMLKAKAPQVPVIVMIPYPSPHQKDFGDADGDGASESLAADNGRRKAVAWFLRAFQERWDKAAFRHLKLWGFYWNDEGIAPPDEAHRAGGRPRDPRARLQVPLDPLVPRDGRREVARARLRPREHAADYAFIPPAGLRRVPTRTPDHGGQHLPAAGAGHRDGAEHGHRHGGPQVAVVAHRDRINRRLYLDHGDDALDGFQAGAVRAYYQGYNAIAGLQRQLRPGAAPAVRRPLTVLHGRI
jgi:hypothetical protein